ncbi:metal ABC transporter substrate-binding protein [Desulfotruncus alcoholivorax]|uniref:metal ABC transporter substrate-binding protein n=1 Tax=Desulfotruncus alcoholivorax TaxID=265477 RepID=UPI0004259B48|nr:metal ABC transporter substrate-binding protein [Desulfotruncus alcoholivorax]
MRKEAFFKYAVCFILAISMFTTGCGINSQKPVSGDQKIKVVTSTTLIADIVQAVGGDKVVVNNIVPPASCPGHFDVKPADMQVLAGSKLFMLHNWQGEQFTDDMIKSAGNTQLQKVILDVQGNWLAPPVRNEAIDKITEALATADIKNGEAYRNTARVLKEETNRIGSAQKKRLTEAGAGKVNVLVNDMQAGFIKWAGFNVVGTFGRAEDLSPKEMEDLIKLGKEQGVSLVIDNLQSGKEAGIEIAKGINCKQLTLNNFPGGVPGTGTWADTITKNVDLLVNLLNDNR